MIPVGRVGDIGVGVCPLHTKPVPYIVTFVSGSATVSANGSPVTIVGTVGTCSCGHCATALTGSATVTAEGMGIHRVGDQGTTGGSYTVIVGSPNVLSG